MSTYWYAVNDDRKEFVFLVGRNRHIDHALAEKLLRKASIAWTAFRVLHEDELEDEHLRERYEPIEPLGGIDNLP